MEKRTIRWMLAILLVLAGAGRADARQTACYPVGSGMTGCLPVMTIPTDWIRCVSDSDCVQVAWSCCSCFEGGISTAINASSMDKYDKRHRKLCPEFYDPIDPARCPQVITCLARVPVPGAAPEFASPFCNARGRCEFGFSE